MPQAPRILVTGATGTIGSHLLRVLSERGVAARALSRDPSRGEELPGITWVAGDLAEPGGLAETFAGVERLFLLTGNGLGLVRLQKNALRAAREAGVLHTVKLSALGASDHSQSLIGMWHWVVERELQAAGMAWTILRPHHFMQNFLEGSLRRGIVEEGVVRSPAGEGRIPFIDTRDIAHAAAVALSEPGHAGKTYHLTGPEAISYRESTEILAEVLGRPLRYAPESEEEARARLTAEGLPDPLVSAQLAIAAYQRAGGATEKTAGAVQELLGRPPRAFQDFVRDHAGSLGR